MDQTKAGMVTFGVRSQNWALFRTRFKRFVGLEPLRLMSQLPHLPGARPAEENP